MQRKIKIVHLSSVHSVTDVRIFLKECKSIAKAGYDVNYVVPCDESKTVEGVSIISVSYPKNRTERIFKTTLNILIKAISLKADIYHFHDPELIPIGIFLCFYGKKVIYDVHEELSNDILDKEWIPSYIRPLISKTMNFIERLSSYCFSGIVITRPSLYKSFDKKKTILVHNYPMIGELSKVKDISFSNRPCIGAYVGGASAERGIGELVEALALLPEECPFKLYIAGIITPSKFYKKLVASPGWSRVEYLGWQTRPQVNDLLSKSRFGIVTFLPIANHLESEPTKIFEYMSAGLPVIASNIPHWDALVRKNGFGILINPQHPKSIADGILQMINNSKEGEEMGKRGKKTILEKYNWENEEKKLISLYKRIVE